MAIGKSHFIYILFCFQIIQECLTFFLDDHTINIGIIPVLCYWTTETSHQNLNQNLLHSYKNHKLGNYFSKASFLCSQCFYRYNSYADMNTVVFTKRYIAKSKIGYKQFSGSILREMQSVNKLDMSESEKISWRVLFCISQ